MKPAASKIAICFLALMMIVATQACGAPQSTTTPAATATPTQIQSPTDTTVNSAEPRAVSYDASSVSSPTSQPTALPSATVTVTVVGGELSIRTGPDTTFDAVASLKDGQTVTALARSIMDGWLKIEMPEKPGEYGWISTLTNYTFINGNVLDLPRIDEVEWNVGSYIRNCTTHRMLVMPGEKILQSVSDTTASRIWFSTSAYSVYDLDVTGQPLVTHIQMNSYHEYTIRKDGDGQKFDCPQ